MKRPIEHIWDRVGKCLRCDANITHVMKLFIKNNADLCKSVKEKIKNDPDSELAEKLLLALKYKIFSDIPCLSDEEMVIKDIIQ
jgi:hypothetical protein